MRSPLEAQTTSFSLLRSVRFFLYMHTLVQIKSPCLLLWQDFFLLGAGLRVWVRNAPVIGLGGYNGDRGTARNTESVCRPSATLLWPQSRRTVLYEVLYSETQTQNSLMITLQRWKGSLLSSEIPPPLPPPLPATCRVVAEQHVPLPKPLRSPPRVFFFVSSPNTYSIN